MSDKNPTSSKDLPSIYIEIAEEHEDGSCTVKFIWDEHDPALSEWNSLSDDERSELIIKTLSDLKDKPLN